VRKWESLTCLRDHAYLLLYFIPLVVVLWLYFRHRARRERVHREALAHAEEAGLREAGVASSMIDASRCIGSRPA